MDLESKQLLESNGFQVIETPWDFTYKTNIFIRHPDGRLNPYYDYLHQIPVLPNGTELDLNRDAMPYDEIYNRPSDTKNAKAITNTEYGLNSEGLPIPPVLVGYIVLSVILLALAICIYFIIHPPAQEPPCGTEGKIIDVSECSKIIIMPNCDSRLYNACDDQWMEDDWHTYEPPAGWVTWLVIGIVAIGAIVIIPPLLRTFRPPPQYPPPIEPE